MKRIFAGLLILTICLSVFNISVFASADITVELVDFLNYINTEDTNNVMVKVTNKTAQEKSVTLVLEVENQSGQNILSKEVSVSLNKKSAVYTPIELELSQTGEYSVSLSAYDGTTLLTSYTEYLFVKNKVKPYDNIGMVTHFDFNTFYELSDIKLLKDSGFSIIRDECRWQNVERVKGKLVIPQHVTQYIDEAKKNGTEVLMMLAFNNTLYSENECDIPIEEDNIKAWLEYVRFVVKELKGKVKYFEVWNEPNHENFNKNNATAAQYTELLKRTYDVIKDEYPEAYVVSGGIAGSSYAEDYIKDMVAAGAMDYLDAFGIHPYCLNGSVVDERDNTTYSSDIDYLSEWGIKKDIWIAEVGYSTHEGEYNDEEKGAFNVRTMLEFIADGRVEKLLLYQLRHVDRGEGYGMIDLDGTAYQSFKIVQAAGERIANADFVKRWTSNRYCSVYQFKDRETDDDIFVIWTKRDRDGSLKLSVGTADEPSASFSGGLLTDVDAELNIGVLNAEDKLYHYDAYGNKTQISVGSTQTLDFKPTYIVCEKQKQQDYLNIEMENGSINGTGYIGEAPQFATVRAVERNSQKTVYLEQIDFSESGEFEFSFKVPSNGVYEIYVYNGEINYEKMNIGSVDTQLSVTLRGELLNKLSQLNENDNIEALATIESKDESLKKVYFVAAVYNHNNKLLFTKVEGADIDTTAPKPIPLEFAATNIKDWKLLKFFVWDAGSLKPLIEDLEF